MPFRRKCAIAALVSTVMLCSGAASGQVTDKPAEAIAGIPVNYSEAQVGNCTLPDPLVLWNGQPVRDAKAWNNKRRPEMVKLAEENQYGRTPGRPPGVSFDVRSPRRTNGARFRPGHGG